MSAENSFMEVLAGGTSSDKTGGSDRGGVERHCGEGSNIASGAGRHQT